MTDDGPSCLTCRWMVLTADAELTTGMSCWRYPPIIVDAEEIVDGYADMSRARPPVFEGDFCGEWAPEPEPLPRPTRQHPGG